MIVCTGKETRNIEKYQEQVAECAQFLRPRLAAPPEWGIILGTGQGVWDARLEGGHFLPVEALYPIRGKGRLDFGGNGLGGRIGFKHDGIGFIRAAPIGMPNIKGGTGSPAQVRIGRPSDTCVSFALAILTGPPCRGNTERHDG